MIVGPTASGKSALAARLLARENWLEGVGVDSFTVYREMQIGTAGLTEQERSEGRYHLIGHVSVTEEYSLGRFLKDLAAVLKDLSDRGKSPLYVGGTALWARAIVNGLQVPPSYPGLRLWLETRIISEQDAQSAMGLLVAFDPRVPPGFDPRNHRRLIRALEVAVGSRGTRSVFGGDLIPNSDVGPQVLGILVPTDVLRERVKERVGAQLEAGWLAEVSAVSALKPSRTARSAIGYAELRDYLEGETTLDEARELIERRTMRLAKRQMAWFKRDPRILWVTSPDEGEELFDRLLGGL